MPRILKLQTAPSSLVEDERRVFYDDVIAGLGARRKRLPCKYFYDRRGSELFDRICELDEYYVTRTELSIMERYGDQMADQLGEGVRLVEYGSGSSLKTRILLDHLSDAASYVPVDISGDYLETSVQSLANAYPRLEITPVCGDFTRPLSLPTASKRPHHTAVYFPGSTIGNFRPREARAILRRIARLCGRGGGLLVGIDLKKSPEMIEAAYNDRQRVTAEFNLNLLHRIKRTLGSDVEMSQFRHRAIYNSQRGRVEMYLISRRKQRAAIGKALFHFERGERICTEYSHKYTIDEFSGLAARAGLRLRRAWTDDRDYFGVLHFIVAS